LWHKTILWWRIEVKTFASMFSGFGGTDIGAMAAGLQPAWGIEYDAAIAEVGNANLGNHIKVADILDCRPSQFDRVDVLHASPPCPSFSVAKANGKETPHDIAMAAKVAEFVTTLQPEVFTLENVMAYRQSQPWRIIEDALYGAGYWLHVDIVNSADYSVAQTRRRMIVRAVRGGMVPYLPEPEPWIGWYAAIEDILHTLPESQFANWQLARLPAELETMLISNGSGYESKLITLRQHAEPSFTITGESYGRVRAFLVDCQNAGNPSGTERGLTIRYDSEPCFTLTSSMGQKCPTRAYTGARVVAMTPRALARFQSFPDWFVLPESKTLAAKGIGNAVPPLMYQKIIGGLIA
jgi:DNA (cytosine-5)-methyltransferase 1